MIRNGVVIAAFEQDEFMAIIAHAINHRHRRQYGYRGKYREQEIYNDPSRQGHRVTHCLKWRDAITNLLAAATGGTPIRV